MHQTCSWCFRCRPASHFRIIRISHSFQITHHNFSTLFTSPTLSHTKSHLQPQKSDLSPSELQTLHIHPLSGHLAVGNLEVQVAEGKGVEETSNTKVLGHGQTLKKGKVQ
jgi:hypothetical protein